MGGRKERAPPLALLEAPAQKPPPATRRTRWSDPTRLAPRRAALFTRIGWGNGRRSNAPDPEHHLVDFRRLVAGAGLPVGGAGVLHLDHHDPVRNSLAAHCVVCTVALWTDDHR